MGAPRVSVVIPSLDAVSRRGLSSLDQQTLGTAEFDVLIGDDGEDAAQSGRLADLAAHRTNVHRFETAPGSAPADRLRAGLSAAGGDFVLVLRGDRRLAPAGLAALCALADKADAEVCIGLTGRAGERPPHSPVPGSADHADLRAGHPLRDRFHGRMVRRELLLSDAARTAGPPEEWESAATDAAARVAAVATQPVFLDGRSGRGATGPADGSSRGVAVTGSRLDCRDGALTIAVQVTAPEGVTGRGLSASVFSEETGIEWAVPDSDVAAQDDGTTRIRFDLERLLAGGPVPEGLWWPVVHADLGEGPVATGIRVAPRRAAGASYAKRPIVTFVRRGQLGVDVGGLRHQLVRRVPAGTARVVEDARGSLLTASVPGVDVSEGVRLEGTVRLGKGHGLPLKAWLEREEAGTARLTSWLSGLQGAAPLFTRFTPAQHAPARALLVIGPTGQMELRKAVPRRRRDGSPDSPSRRRGTDRGVRDIAAGLARGAVRRARRRLSSR